MLSGPVLHPAHADRLGAVSAAVEGPLSLDAVADDTAPAVVAAGGQGVDRALEAVEDVGGAPTTTSKLLSYSLPQTSHCAMVPSFE